MKETVIEMLVCSLFNQLTQLVAQGSFMEHPVTCMLCYFALPSVTMFSSVKKFKFHILYLSLFFSKNVIKMTKCNVNILLSTSNIRFHVNVVT